MREYFCSLAHASMLPKLLRRAAFHPAVCCGSSFSRIHQTKLHLPLKLSLGQETCLDFQAS